MVATSLHQLTRRRETQRAFDVDGQRPFPVQRDLIAVAALQFDFALAVKGERAVLGFQRPPHADFEALARTHQHALDPARRNRRDQRHAGFAGCCKAQMQTVRRGTLHGRPRSADRREADAVRRGEREK